MAKSLPSNPLRGFWDAVSVGGVPRDQDLEAEGFPKGDWPAVRRGIREVHALKAEGENAQARGRARELASSWWERLDEGYEALVERDLPDDPRALARLVLGEEVPPGEADPRALAASIPRDRMS